MDGVGVFLDNANVKPGEKIKLLLTGAPNSQINLRVSSLYNNQLEIGLNQEIYGICKKGTPKTYALSLKNFKIAHDFSLIIKLKRYSGKPIFKVSGSRLENSSDDSNLL